MSIISFHQEQLDRIEDILRKDFDNLDIHFVLLIDVGAYYCPLRSWQQRL